MQNAVTLTKGMFADLDGDWRVYVVEADVHHPGVFYIGSFPYDETGSPLHPECPAIARTWDGKEPGARQISERQKRVAHYAPAVHFEPVIARQFA